MGDRVDLYSKSERLAVFALTEWESKTTGKTGTRFTQIGGASINRDGSLNIYLDLLPGKGQTIQVRTVKARDESPDGGRSWKKPDEAGDGPGPF